MLLVTTAEVRLGIDGLQTHLPHVTLDRFAIHMPPPGPQDRRDPTGTVERKLRVDLVDLPFERHFLLTRPSRLVVQMCSVQAQKLCLGLYRQFAVLPIDECKPLTLSLTRFGGHKRLVSERCPSRRFKHAANASTIPT